MEEAEAEAEAEAESESEAEAEAADSAPLITQAAKVTPLAFAGAVQETLDKVHARVKVRVRVSPQPKPKPKPNRNCSPHQVELGLQQSVGEQYAVRSSMGCGGWASVPWLAVSHPSESTQHGLYLQVRVRVP